VIFGDYLDVSYDLCLPSEQPGHGIKIFYGVSEIKEERACHIPAHHLLAETDIRPHQLDVGYSEDLPYLYQIQRVSDYDLPFDLFAMIFYLITRYEEYYDTPRDQHGRYQSDQSIAVKEGFLHLPLVDLWIQRLADLLSQKSGTSFSLHGTYQCLPTIDIDLPYAYKHKRWKAYVGMLKDVASFNVTNISAREHFWKTGADPFDTYEWMSKKLSHHNHRPQIFVLNQYKLPHDENHLCNTSELSDLIKGLSKWSDIGVHPSISSSGSPKVIKKELSFLEKSLQKEIRKSRQHFLKMSFPDTYQSLLAAGLTDDYSMSYPDVIGFRASTARPYLWYDLSSEVITDLTIHSNQVMDVTLRYYLKLSPEEAMQKCQELMEVTKSVNGTFSFIWHNSSLSKAYGWGEWVQVFEWLISRP